MNQALFKFCLVGLFVTGVDFGALWVTRRFLPDLLAVTVAYFVAVATHFSLNKWWVFRAQANVRATEVARYVLTVFVCWVCTVSVVWLALRFATSKLFVAKLLAIPPTTLLGFLLMRKFVFR